MLRRWFSWRLALIVLAVVAVWLGHLGYELFRNETTSTDPWVFIRPAQPTRASESDETIIADLERYIPDAMTRFRIPGVSIALTRGTRVIWNEGFGWADVDQRVAMRADTPFVAASLSKVATSIGVLLLVDRNQLDLDEDVVRYLGSGHIVNPFQGDAEVTARELLNHTSGLPWEHPALDPTQGRPLLDRLDPDLHLRLSYAPGRRWPLLTSLLGTPTGEYPSLGYHLAGALIERVSGERFESYMQARVFQPLQMPNSSFLVSDAARLRIPKAYTLDGQPVDHQEFLEAIASRAPDPSFSMVTTTGDMARMLTVLASRGSGPDGSRLLSEAAVDEMLQPSSRINFIVTMGLGFIRDRNPWAFRVWFPGTSNLYAVFACYPDSQYCAVVMTNLYAPRPMGLILRRAIERQ